MNASQCISIVLLFITTINVCNAKKVVIVSAGFDDGNYADFIIDHVSVYKMKIPGAPSDAGRGMNVAVMDEKTGSVTQVKRFDVYASATENSMLRAYLYSIPVGRIVLFAAKDEASNRLDKHTRWLIKQWGGNRIANIGIRDSWCMIGKTGSFSSSKKEQLIKRGSGAAAVVDRNVKLGPHSYPPGSALISVFSAGFDDGNNADIFFNGRSIFHSGYTGGVPKGASRGLNIAIFDEVKIEFESYHHVDTYSSPSAMSSLQKILRSLTYGRIVVIAVRDEGSAKFDRYTAWMVEQLGSKQVKNLKTRNSWYLIGRVGARSDYPFIFESLKNRYAGYAEIRTLLSAPLALPAQRRHTMDISVYSSGYEDGNQADIYTNGRSIFSFGSSYPTAPKRGLNIAVINQETGALVTFRTFDTHTKSGDDLLRSFLRRLARGRVVIIAVRDEAAQRLTSTSREMLKALGSSKISELGYRMGWCMIGRVNAAPNSAIESVAAKKSGPAICRNSYYLLL